MAYTRMAIDPIGNFRYRVTFVREAVSAASEEAGSAASDSDDSGTTTTFKLGCNEVDGLKKTVAVMEYRDGAMPTYPIKVPGQTSFGNVTFKRALIYASENSSDYFAAMLDRARKGRRQEFRYTVTIEALHPSGTAAYTWELERAFAVDHSVEKLDANGNEILLHTLEMAYENLVENAQDESKIGDTAGALSYEDAPTASDE